MHGKIFNIQKFSLNDGPGIRTTVFFAGCPLRCRWCSNPESQDRNAAAVRAMEDHPYRGREYSVAQVMGVIRQDIDFYIESGGGLTLSGGEVLQQAAFAEALIDAAHAEGIHCAVETTGFVDPGRFLEFLPLPDLFLYDFKHYDREIHHRFTGVYNDIILENLRAVVAAGKPVIARIPVIPRFNVGIRHARGLAKALTDIGVREVHLLPFHPEALENYRRVFIDAGLDCSFQ